MRPETRRPNAPHTQEGGRMLIDNAPALLRAAAEVMNITPDDITGKRKTFAEALARQIVMTLWAESHSLQSACEIVGRIHHTSAVYARGKILSKLQYCENTRERVRKVMQKYSENILATPNPEP
jgi:chromosomal replication initiation ATPase DnaA